MQLIDEDTEKSIRDEVPNFVETIETAKKDDVDTVLFTLGAFEGEPERCYGSHIQIA